MATGDGGDGQEVAHSESRHRNLGWAQESNRTETAQVLQGNVVCFGNQKNILSLERRTRSRRVRGGSGGGSEGGVAELSWCQDALVSDGLVGGTGRGRRGRSELG